MNNIIFDGNYLLYKNVFTLNKMNRLYGDLWTALDNNISKYMSMCKWSNVFIVADSNKTSWRKAELDQYKAQRSRLEDVDWTWVFEQFNLWKESVGQKYKTVETDHIEGDDWITSIVLKTNKMGHSNLVISSDKDLLQLLNYKVDGEKSWINMQINDINGKETVFLPIGWELWLKEYDEHQNTDIFNLDNSYEWLNFFNRTIKHWQYEEINPKELLFMKLVKGDKSDNILSVYQKLTTTGKLQGIGDAGAKKVWEFYRDNYKDYFNTSSTDFVGEVVNCIERVNNVTFDDQRRANVEDNIRRNIKLIELHYKHFPDWVVENIVAELDEKI